MLGGTLDPEQLATPNVEVTWAVPDAPLPAAIDRQMLRRVLINLVRNAVQAVRARTGGREGGEGDAAAPRGHVRVSAQADRDGTTLLVEDDGPGIPVAGAAACSTRTSRPRRTARGSGSRS